MARPGFLGLWSYVVGFFCIWEIDGDGSFGEWGKERGDDSGDSLGILYSNQ